MPCLSSSLMKFMNASILSWKFNPKTSFSKLLDAFGNVAFVISLRFDGTLQWNPLVPPPTNCSNLLFKMRFPAPTTCEGPGKWQTHSRTVLMLLYQLYTKNVEIVPCWIEQNLVLKRANFRRLRQKPSLHQKHITWIPSEQSEWEIWTFFSKYLSNIKFVKFSTSFPLILLCSPPKDLLGKKN